MRSPTRRDDRRRRGRLARAALIASVCYAMPWSAAGQPPPVSAPPASTSQSDPEARTGQAAPVLVGGDPILWVNVGAGPYSPQYRAERISRRLADAVGDRSIRDPTVTVTESEGSSELRMGTRLLMVVTAGDAAAVGTGRELVARQYARELETAIRDERLRRAPATLVRSGLYGLVATLVLAAAVWLLLRFTRWIRSRIERWWARRRGVFDVDDELFEPDRVSRAIDGLIAATRVVLLLVLVDLYLTYVLGLFPWTRAISRTLLDYALAPVRAAAGAFVSYLPKLLFVIVIVAIDYAVIRLVGVFFKQIRTGRITFANFPEDWADPTRKIVTVLLIAFGVVVAFPYLPASDSPAFAGVSVFMGLLVSLAASSSLSNMIAGLVLTYTRAFRLGDRVKVGDAFGDIIENSLLATRIRTIKNEEITIPNGVVLANAVTNYSRGAAARGLILHTSVTIGYDAPWRTVHELLIKAAHATAGVLTDPPPFVWQTALNDFYVCYEINVYTDQPQRMPDTYAALHAEIQDAFNAAGVEIMSPHYTSLRDGNTVTIPEHLRAHGYRAPAFRVETSKPDPAAVELPEPVRPS